MPRASSSRKVARAAGTGGGRTDRARTPWTYVGVIAIIVVLGVVGVVVSRNQAVAKTNSAGSVPPTVGGAAWNEAYAVDVCGTLQAPIDNKRKNVTGITTTDNGIIHIEPLLKSAAGKNATLGKFATSVGMELSATELKLPGGKAHRSGTDCNGKPAYVYVQQFAYAGDTSGVLEKGDPASVLLADQSMATIAFVTKAQSAHIPAPPTSVQDALEALATATTTTTTVAGSTTATTVSTATTVPSATTTTPATTTTSTTSTTLPKTTTTTKKS